MVMAEMKPAVEATGGAVERLRPGAAMSRGQRIACGALAAALLWFLWQGPGGATPAGGEFATLHDAARLWLEGSDPYVQGVAHPPSALFLMAPLGAVDQLRAGDAWLTLNLVALASLLAMLHALMVQYAPLASNAMLPPRLAKSAVPPTTSLWLFVAVLAIAPVHAAFAGQLALMSAMLALAAFAAARRERPVLAGVLAGLAAALRPQVGIAVILYFIVRQHGRCLYIAALTFAFCFALGTLQLQVNAPQWLAHWQANRAAVSSAPDALNLHAILRAMINDRGAVTVLAAAGGIAVVLFAQGVMPRRPSARGEVRFFAVLCIASLLALPGVRFSDGVWLVLPLIPAVTVLGSASRLAYRAGIGALIAVAVFVLPGAAILHDVTASGRALAGWSDNFLFNFLIRSHATWALCVLLGWMLWDLSGAGRRPVRAKPAEE